MKFSTKLCRISILFSSFITLFFGDVKSQSSLWTEADANLVYAADRYSVPASFRTISLDISVMRNVLASAPLEFTGDAKSKNQILSLPMPDGSMAEVSVQETQVMSPGLAAHYPQIKTYTLQGITDRFAHGRIDVTNFGFHAMILSPRGDVFIDPVSNDNDRFYISYFKKDLPRHDDFSCGVNDSLVIAHPDLNQQQSGVVRRSSGDELRTYRLALACTGEYAATKGGTVSGALSGMVTSVNRVDGVYEQEVSVRLQLIDNDTLLICLNSATDPYTNNDGGTMLGQNQNNIDDVIGSANYDIGHVFSTGGGGVAQLDAVCRGSLKAQGVTGLSNPVGDAFDIDYVAHEMGHQFGGNHTFNCETESCNGNRNGPTAFEPGSGTTIMAYAGICGTTNDLQKHSDAFFHTGSYDEILNYTMNDFGNNCPVITETGNNLPVVTTGPDFSIPYKTPFLLEGSATDADGETLTYCWEEKDHGPPGDWNSPSGQAPCFRSWAEDTVSYRYFPKMNTIVKNYPDTAKGEVLPDYARTFNFRLTARDHHAGGGGVTYNDIPVKLTVVNTGSPFQVTFPNTQINWPINTEKIVTWDVSATDVSPINCSKVNVLLSTDGGFTYPITLASNIPNSGSVTVMMPNDVSLVGINTARIMVQSVGNIFFDISNENFSTFYNVGISTVADISSQVSIYPNPVDNELNIEVKGMSNESVMLSVLDNIGRVVFHSEQTEFSGQKDYSIDMRNVPSGIYFIKVNTGSGESIKKVVKD